MTPNRFAEMLRRRFASCAAVALAAAWLLSAVPARAAAAFLASVDAPKPAGLAVDPSFERLLVAEKDGTLAIVDTRSFKQLRSASLTCCLNAVAADITTHEAWVSGNGVLVVDEATGLLEATISVAPAAAGAIVIGGGRAYVANGTQIAVIDTATRSVVARWDAGGTPSALALDGSTLYATDSAEQTLVAIDTADGSLARTIPVPQPVALALDSAGREAFVASSTGNVYAYDEDSFAFKRTLYTGSTAPAGIAFNPGNGRLWVPDSSSTTVAMMRSADGVVLGHIPIGRSPVSAVFDPTFAHVYVACVDSGTVVSLGEGPGIVQILSPVEGGYVGPSKRILTGAAPAGSPVTLYENGAQIGFTYATIQSTWTITIPLAEGRHTVVATVPEERPSDPRTFGVDMTAPVLHETSRTPPGPSGWNNTVVAVHWSCVDDASGTDTPDVSALVLSEGRTVTTTGTCKDRAGNQGTFTSTGFMIDRTAPVITTSHLPSATLGWNRSSPVTSKLSCSDPLSGVSGAASYSEQVSGQTTGHAVELTCADVAGNVRAKQDIVRIDLTKPLTTIDSTVPVAAPNAPINGTGSDSPSGPWKFELRITDARSGASFVGVVPCTSGCGGGVAQWSFDPPTGMMPGVYTVEARTTDMAGNVGDWTTPVTFLILANPL